MAKKYTIMFFSTDRLGKVRTFNVSRKLLIGTVVSFFVVAIALAASLVHLRAIVNERDNLLTYNNENSALKSQLSQYTQQIEDISTKISRLDDLEYKIRDLVTLQKGNLPLKPIAVGGKEVDLLREYSSAAALNEKDFFSTLEGTLDNLSFDVSEREANLSELATALEEKRLVMLYTPTMIPVNGWMSSPFGYRISPFTSRQTFHEGVDIAARYGAEVHAAAKGIVVFAGIKAGYGHLVTIDHGYGYITRYGHNSSLNVKVGERVEKGQVIAKVGNSGNSTGPHMHYEVLVNGIPVNPLKFIIDDTVN